MVELELQGVVMPEEHKYPVVLLRHEMKVLPILVGPAEADAIQRGLLGEKTARPMTHDLLKNILAGLRAELKSVTIYRLENDTFYAHLNVEQRSAQGQLEQVLRIDTRPSDGIAIAVRVGCPILATEDVMNKAAQDASVLAEADDPDDDDADDAFEEEEDDRDEALGYKTIALATTGLMGGKIDPVQLDKVLNPLGEAGWEIAAGFDTNQAYGQSRDVVIILRREKP